MRWPWQRANRTAASPVPRLLPSATPGVPFEATFTLVWRPTLRRRPNLDELVRYDNHKAAAEVAVHLEATDLPTAQDTINAALGAPSHVRTPYYRLLAAQVALRLSPTSREHLTQRRVDEERVRRLQFLKSRLYDHPDLVVLDRLEHHPELLHDEEVAALQRLARSIRACDRWWYPLLEQWEQLGHGFNDADKQQQAMLALLDSLKTLNAGSPPAPSSSS
ncbi:hypothetical protein ACNPQM_27905 [Streptomyces sp. NPDC056231]|uniref:hypothetical protein n=1 Tax=Streptomyces sp. NPDC056231 TaxID=3345755 RepID=UPI003AAA3A74